MSIQENIQEVADRIGDELDASGGTTSATANNLHVLAVRAILSGGRRADGTIPDAWQEYMELFAKSPGELARLLPTDGTHTDADKEDARAYLVAGGMCTPGTTQDLAVPVRGRLNL